jgi:hypothetical protein
MECITHNGSSKSTDIVILNQQESLMAKWFIQMRLILENKIEYKANEPYEKRINCELNTTIIS